MVAKWSFHSASIITSNLQTTNVSFSMERVQREGTTETASTDCWGFGKDSPVATTWNQMQV